MIFDLNNNYYIEASAGTGKTYTICEIVKNYVKTIPLNKILVVTYTEKATGEIRNRIRIATGQNVDDAPIYTIHSFCQSVIKEFAVNTNCQTGLDVLDKSFIDNFVEGYIKSGPIVKLCREHGDTLILTGNLKDILISLLDKYYLDCNGNIDHTIFNVTLEFDYEALFNKFINKEELTKDEEGLLGYAIAFHYLDDCYKAFQKAKDEKRVQSFNDMIRSVREAILNGDGSLTDKLRAKYDLVIIDEFQDTNQLQWDIFKKIFLCDRHHIIVVGDPKQSIYSFQGTDVLVYKKAIDEMKASGAIAHPLTKNYRSRPEVVEASNALFSTKGYSSLDFKPSESININDNVEIKKCLYKGQVIKPFFISKYLDKENDKVQVFEVIVQQMLDYCTYENGHTNLQLYANGTWRDVNFQDFAVLYKAGYEAKILISLFNKYGIPYVKNKDRSLFKGIECVHFITILEAINMKDFTNRNREYFKRALFTTFFGYSFQDISKDYFDMNNSKEFDLFTKWRNILSKKSYEELIDAIFDTNLAGKLSGPTNIQSLTTFNQIGEFAIAYLNENHTLQELINELYALYNSNEDDDNNILKKGTDYHSVQMMSLHSSKGLQFPIVINIGGISSTKNDASIYMYHDESGNPCVTHIKNEQVCLEEEQEFERLFYVGNTRSEYITMLPYYAFFNLMYDGSCFLETSLAEFIDNYPEYYETKQFEAFRNTNDVKKVVKTILDHQQEKLNESGSLEDQIEANKTLIEKNKNRCTTKHSYSSLSYQEIDEGEYLDIDDRDTIMLDSFDSKAISIDDIHQESVETIDYSAYPRGARVGTALHEIFELLDFNDYENTDLEKLITNAFSNVSIDATPIVSQTIQIVNNVMNAKLPRIIGDKKTGEMFKLCSLQNNDCVSEVEFNFNLQQQFLKNYCNGFIDLIFKIGDCYAILDWKSDTLSEEFLSYTDAYELRKHVNEHYAIQRTLYAYCLINWLKQFYPNLNKQEIFEQHFGGIYYVFFKGCVSNTSSGIYAQTWENYQALEDAFNEIINIKIGGCE